MRDYSNRLRAAAQQYLDNVIEDHELDLLDPYSQWADVDAQRSYITALKDLRASVRTVPQANTLRGGVRLAAIPRVSSVGEAALDYAASEVFSGEEPLIFTENMIVF